MPELTFEDADDIETAERENATTKRREKQQQRRDVTVIAIATVILSFAVLATAWCSYQASLWGGVQAASYNRAGALRVRSTRAMISAGQLQIIDVGTFRDWAHAYETGDTVFATFLRKRFRAEFNPAFEAWVASRPMKNPAAAATPFTLPEYRLALWDSAARYEAEANQLFAEGQRANTISDRYVLDTVLFALALFFAGVVQQGRFHWLRVMMLAMSLLVIAFAVSDMVIHPRGSPPPRRV